MNGRVERRLVTPGYIRLFFLGIPPVLAYQVVATVVVRYAVAQRLPVALAGTVAGATSACGLVFRPFSGPISDRLNLRHVLSFSLFGMSGAALAVCMAKTAVPLMMALGLFGACYTLASTAEVAVCSRYIPAERLGEGIGYVFLGHAVASSLGPVISLWVLDNGGYIGCFFTAAVLTGLSGSMAITCRGLRKPEDELRISRMEGIVSRPLLPLAGFTCAFAMFMGLVSAFLRLYAEERGLDASAFFLVNALVSIAVRPMLGKLQDRKNGFSQVMIAAILSTVVCLSILAVARGEGAVLAAGMFMGTGYSVAYPALQAECQRRGKGKTGVAGSTCYLGYDVGRSISPGMGGWIVLAGGYANLFACAATFFAAGVFPLFVLWSRHDGRRHYDG